MNNLTAKQEAFAIEYVRNGRNGSDAYRISYKNKTTDKQVWEEASKLLANPKVRQRIEELAAPIAAKAEKNLGMTREWVLEQLRKVAAMGMAAEPVRDSEGNPIGEYKSNLAASNKALELIGKEIAAMFVDRKEIRTGTILPEDIEHKDLQVIDAELKRLGIAVPGDAGRTSH